MTTLAIIHTTPATVDPLKALAAELLPGVAVANWVDDSILPQLARNGGDTNEVASRLIQYALIAESVGANVILEACSSVGEVVPQMRAAVRVPVLRVDDAMAEAAVQRGVRVGVAATIPTTLHPTTRLIEAKARVAGKSIHVETALADGAYRRLMAGDRDGHDAELAAVIESLAARVDVLVLAQASMARVLPRLSPGVQARTLTSPRLAMERIRALLQSGGDPPTEERA